MIRLVTDSASMIPPTLRERFDVAVVPVVVVVDGHQHREGVDLPAEEFYDSLARGLPVTTAAPSPGEVEQVFRALADSGADRILSVNTGADYSATIGSFEIAARMTTVPVTVVDTGAASFPVTLCTWAAGDVVLAGGGLAHAAAAARQVASEVGSVFVVGVPELARSGGRFGSAATGAVPTSVLEFGPTGLVELDTLSSLGSAVDYMVEHIASVAADRPLRVGVGDALRPEPALALLEGLEAVEGVVEVVRYEVGPSIGAHTGAGTVGVVYAPAV